MANTTLGNNSMICAAGTPASRALTADEVMSCNVNATSGSQKWVSVVIRYVRALKNEVKMAQTLDRPLASPFTTPSQLDVCSAVMAFLRSNLRQRPYQQAFASSVVSRLSRRIRRRHSCCNTCSTPARTEHTACQTVSRYSYPWSNCIRSRLLADGFPHCSARKTCAHMVEELALLERAVPTSPATARTNRHPGVIFLAPFRTPESDKPSSSNATSFPSCSRAATSLEIVRTLELLE